MIRMLLANPKEVWKLYMSRFYMALTQIYLNKAMDAHEKAFKYLASKPTPKQTLKSTITTGPTLPKQVRNRLDELTKNHPGGEMLFTNPEINDDNTISTSTIKSIMLS